MRMLLTKATLLFVFVLGAVQVDCFRRLARPRSTHSEVRPSLRAGSGRSYARSTSGSALPSQGYRDGEGSSLASVGIAQLVDDSAASLEGRGIPSHIPAAPEAAAAKLVDERGARLADPGNGDGAAASQRSIIRNVSRQGAGPPPLEAGPQHPRILDQSTRLRHVILAWSGAAQPELALFCIGALLGLAGGYVVVTRSYLWACNARARLPCARGAKDLERHCGHTVEAFGKLQAGTEPLIAILGNAPCCYYQIQVVEQLMSPTRGCKERVLLDRIEVLESITLDVGGETVAISLSGSIELPWCGPVASKEASSNPRLAALVLDMMMAQSDKSIDVDRVFIRERRLGLSARLWCRGQLSQRAAEEGSKSYILKGCGGADHPAVWVDSSHCSRGAGGR